MIELDEPLESAYFNWLSAKIMKIKNPTPSLTYWKLLRELQNTEFVWLVPMDDNRAEDGKELRHEFLRLTGIRADEGWFDVGCSIFEMIVAMSGRASFQTDRSPSDWFWEIMDNLGLSRYNDAEFKQHEVSDILYTLVWRTYDYNGNGGMFPIERPQYDQRKVEIWDQFSEYLVDRDLI